MRFFSLFPEKNGKEEKGQEAEAKLSLTTARKARNVCSRTDQTRIGSCSLTQSTAFLCGSCGLLWAEAHSGTRVRSHRGVENGTRSSGHGGQYLLPRRKPFGIGAISSETGVSPTGQAATLRTLRSRVAE